MRAACIAIDDACGPFAPEGPEGGTGGGLGAADGGGGGAIGGGGAGDVDGGGGGGAAGAETFLEAGGAGGGGGGLLDPGTGGGARGGGTSGLVECVDIEDDGLGAGRGGGFRRLATSRLTGGIEVASVDGGGDGRKVGALFDGIGGLGAAPGGGGVLELLCASESDRYDAFEEAPVSIPPRFLSLGIPPANKPPSCGADGTPSSPPDRSFPALLLLSLFAAPPGTGGASPPGGLGAIPGTGGAPATGGPPEPPDVFPIRGADLSFVTVFLSLVPLEISERRAV